MVNRFEKFLYTITEIDLFIHRITTAEMKAFDLKGNYVIYFTKLQEHPEGVSAARLALMCGKDKADISRDISALEKAGFVRRDMGDGSLRPYRAPISLTEKGREVSDEIICKVNDVVEKIGAGLSDSDRECLYRSLDLIAANMEAISRQEKEGKEI